MPRSVAVIVRFRVSMRMRVHILCDVCMLVAMDRSIGMHMLMRVPLMRNGTVYRHFSLAAAAGRAHAHPL